MARLMVARLIPILLLGAAWEVFAQSGAVTPFMLPPLSAVALRIWSDELAGDLALNTGLTLYRALTGFLIAAVAGVALGCAMSRSAGARWFFDPIISVGFPMPKIAFLPIGDPLARLLRDTQDRHGGARPRSFRWSPHTLAGLQGVERELIWSAATWGRAGAR